MTACHYHNLPWCRLSGCITSRFLSVPFAYSSSETGIAVGARSVYLRVGSDICLQSFVYLPQIVISKDISRDSWGVLSSTCPSVCLSVSVHPHLSLSAKAFRGCLHKSVRQMGGPAFCVSLEGHPGTKYAAPQCSVSEPWETQIENQCSETHAAKLLWTVPPYPVCVHLPSAELL